MAAAAARTKAKTNGRLSFARIPEVMEMPYLLETQKQSYAEFLQFETATDQREDRGLQEVFKSVFPISAPGDPSTLEFVDYSFGTPKYTVKESIDRGMTYSSQLKLKLQLIVRELNEETGQVELKDIKEQEVYMGEVPLMTDQGTFIINGAERVIVSQLHRSPGVSFGTAVHPNGKLTYSARIIPYRGAWVEFEIDIYGVMYVMIDRKRKIAATTFLRAFGYSNDEKMAEEFFECETIRLSDFSSGLIAVENLHEFLGSEYAETVLDDAGKTIVERGQKVTKKSQDLLRRAGYDKVQLSVGEAYDQLMGRVLGRDVIDEETGEILAETFEVITSSLLRSIAQSEIRQVRVVKLPNPDAPGPILNTLNKDKIRSEEEALVEFFRKMRPGNPVSVQASRRLMEETFFDTRRYDLGAVGRYKINKRFYSVGTGTGDLTRRLLSTIDLIHVMKHLARLAAEEVEVDDIDHLGNRRVRCVGELLQNQIRMGLAEIEKTARERMSIVDLENMLPQNLINSKPLVTAVRDFFGRSQLSQFMDQTNPLAELTHKRRLSALGPGGLSRDRAGFEVRDVHHTHYGRICPIETPEGPNIGLISSLSTYARINPFGFIETPYRRVTNSTVATSLKEMDYLTADVEDEFTIAQANAPLDDNHKFRNKQVLSRRKSDYPKLPPSDVQYMDISPKQLVSVSAALIPFLEHDDANRALMGSNMQRQAVPLLFTDAPLVGTGIEEKVALDSGVCHKARRAGVCETVTSEEIIIRTESGETDHYHLEKYKRSNQNTCMNQRPIVREGDKVGVDAVLADGAATDKGELALGRNVMVAFMSAGGYNFEDAILLSERLVAEDAFTSIHIEEFEVDARDTKLGKEEITRDIPNIGEEALAKLDENGHVFVGAKVGPNDILVGKVTPKGETELSSEEKLLRAIFGEKAGDVRDASLKVPAGTNGIVIDIKTFSRKERGQKTERDDRLRIEKIETEKRESLDGLWAEFNERLAVILAHLDRDIVNFETGKTEMRPGDKPSKAALDYIRHNLQTGMLPVDGKVGNEIKKLFQEINTRRFEIEDRAKNQVDRIKTGDELSPGVIKLVKVYVASKRKVSVGDKMAGRHGNKGVVAKIMPIEDMPFLADGTHVDVVLNPLGVPSRMNVGQILETHLGWASKEIGRQVTELCTKVGAAAARKRLEDVFSPPTSVEHPERIETYAIRQKIGKMSDQEILDYCKANEKGFRFATPVFDGAKEEEIFHMLEKAGLPRTGQAKLFDGRTGDAFDRSVTVGIIYILKLAHLVDDKMHARSIGPYSLVTQQPLGGKAQFGGQRFGEMEVWALEAYGAAYTLQELLTVKSDDVNGRTKIYEAIVKGQSSVTPGIPESFNVLVKELQSLGLNLELLIEEESAVEPEAYTALEGVDDDSFLDDGEFNLDDDEVPTRAGASSADDDDDIELPATDE